MRVHVDTGLQLNRRYSDLFLTAGGSDSECDARVYDLEVLPIVDLRLVKSDLPAGLGQRMWPAGSLRCPPAC